MPARVNDSARATSADPRSRSHDANRDSRLGLFALLLALRIVNALTLRTFFQPDEFFQSLEPAWQLAYGQSSNAWITWEWKTQLRSSLHPAIFAAVYQVAAKLADLCGLNLPERAELLVAAPKVAQAVSAAVLDYYTWQLAARTYGRGSRTAVTTLLVSLCSPWQWFCSTRTLSNCLETAVTATAVYYWPWHWPTALPSGDAGDRQLRNEKGSSHIADGQASPGHVSELRLSLLLAAFACILRPTNALVWLSVSLPTLWQASMRQRYVLVREILFCGLAILAVSVLSDRLYYQAWTLPPLRFLYFNIAQSLAVFYGRNRADYYLTEGLPLLLTTALPFAAVGLWQGLSGKGSRASSSSRPPVPRTAGKNAQKEEGKEDDGDAVPCRILNRLSWTCLIMTLTLSLISHKEVRFLYPILPFLHVLASGPLTAFLSTPSLARKSLLALLLAANVFLAGYASQVHQRGVIDVLSFLRHEHEARVLQSTSGAPVTTTAAFLMPCHSTPWRSHLVHPSLSAWALTCEPPIDVPLADRDAYLDEADQFYIQPGPAAWLDAHMQPVAAVSAAGSRSGRHWAALDPKVVQGGRRREWPRYLVLFAQLEPVLGEYLAGSRYAECWRGFNSHFHDDWRRVGDVVVWCLE
ncbi:hypothetical protein BS50DRAFT_576550 [Corynespora cassiicola Philippines]|uniref:Mannosyltransferase n=1 Tax=Corynespora cassiicola Philippines TaxID=1448308 RepID=A0A2T2NEX2_CORCC|nr:hypothetical protein BS50DRAFT_576550 [Corynespora cassiicola Philippines]